MILSNFGNSIKGPQTNLYESTEMKDLINLKKKNNVGQKENEKVLHSLRVKGQKLEHALISQGNYWTSKSHV